ncbi:MAG: ABC transporter substrate-binding protein, partial [Chloroflexota bacterium]
SPSYALNPQYDFVGLHTQVTGVRAINSDTVVFNLNVSNAHFPDQISAYYYAPVVSPTDVAKGPADPLFGTGIADGPWYLSNYTSGSTTALMLPNPYWVGLKPTACALHVIFTENSAQFIPFLVSGQADFSESLAYGNIAALQGHPDIHLNNEAGAAATPLWYNVTSYPYNMTEFRQALAYSINSSAIVQQSLFGFGVPSNNAQGEVPSSIAFYTPNQPQYPYNLSKALSLLHQIGFTGGGSLSTPLKFPNGTAMTTTIFTDTSRGFDTDIAQQVVGFLQNLGISVQTVTLTSQNLAADAVSNAFNIRNNLVIYTSLGPVYFSPWLDAQQGCNVMGTPGCAGWTATPSPASTTGQTQWLYPATADAQYQSNLTAIDNTPPTSSAAEQTYLNNIQALTAQYLPAVILVYPNTVRAYSTAHWTHWPSFYFAAIGENQTMFTALQPVTTSTTSTGVTSTSSSTSTSSTSATGTTHTTTTTTSSSNTGQTSTTASSTNIGTIELIAGIVIVIIIIGGVAAYMMRRRPAAT